jgi:N-carbamoylputrescine amidase
VKKTLRVALVETVNAYAAMPATTARLDELADKLDALREANLDKSAALIAKAARAGADVVGLGELFGAPYFALERRELWLSLAEDLRAGPTVARMQQLAKEHGVIVVAPIYELDPSGKRFNSAAVIDAGGRLLGCYRKTHIPEGQNERGSFHETFYYQRSDGEGFLDPAHTVHQSRFFPVFITPKVRIGVAICYDRHFEGVMHSLAATGAELVLCPAVTFGDKSRRMWRHEFATDAARHSIFIAGSNRRGIEPPFTIEYFGDSHVVGPNGVAKNLSDDPDLVIAEIDLAELGAGDPSGWNLPRDRRPEILVPSGRAPKPG